MLIAATLECLSFCLLVIMLPQFLTMSLVLTIVNSGIILLMYILYVTYMEILCHVKMLILRCISSYKKLNVLQ